MYKGILFDWHGVLDNVQFEGLALRLSAMICLDIQTTKIRLSKKERAYARGDIESKEFWDFMAFEFSLPADRLESLRSYILSIDPTDLWDHLPALSRKYKLGILSDCPRDKIEQIRSKIDLRIFSITHFSAERQQLKDEDSFFITAAASLGVDPKECVYVDDREKHVLTAERLGFVGCRYEKIEDLQHVVSW